MPRRGSELIVIADCRDLAPLTVTHRQMWQTIIELCCRQTNVSQALMVFDDWKAASLMHIKVHLLPSCCSARGSRLRLQHIYSLRNL